MKIEVENNSIQIKGEKMFIYMVGMATIMFCLEQNKYAKCYHWEKDMK